MTPTQIVQSQVSWSPQLPLRAVFPLYTRGGQLYFFIARSVVGEEPKVLYPKKAYGWHTASEVLYGSQWLTSKKVVLVEGVFDVFATPNSVAILGKVLHKPQFYLLLSLCEEVTICLDADAAQESEFIARWLQREAPWLKVSQLRLAPGEDPASTGREAMIDLLAKPEENDVKAFPTSR
jgi:DNA primase